MGGESVAKVNKRIYECIKNARQMLNVSIKAANETFEESVNDARMKFEESIASSKHKFDTSVIFAKQALEDTINEAKLHLVGSEENLDTGSSSCQQTSVSNKPILSNRTGSSSNESDVIAANHLDKNKCRRMELNQRLCITGEVSIIDEVSVNFPNPLNNDLENTDLLCHQSNDDDNVNEPNTFLTDHPTISVVDQRLFAIANKKSLIDSSITPPDTQVNSVMNENVPNEEQFEAHVVNNNNSDKEKDSAFMEIKVEFEDNNLNLPIEQSYNGQHLNTSRPQEESRYRKSLNVQNVDMSAPHTEVTEMQSENSSININQAYSRDRFECNACGIKFITKYLLLNHFCRPYQRIEPKQPAQNQENSKHKTTINLKFKCDLCEKMFANLKTLNFHSKSVHNPLGPSEQLKCDICEKLLATQSSLKRHLDMHKGIKPFKCEVCGKSFSQKQHFKDHLDMHKGIKPFKCDVCGKSFRRRKSLKSHLCLWN